MKFKLNKYTLKQTLALASAATVVVTGVVQAQEAVTPAVPAKPSAPAAEILGIGSVAPALAGVTWYREMR